MKTLVVYSSQTGNTKKLAETVADTLNGEVSVCHISKAPAPDGFDLVALGFWLQGGKPDPKSTEYLAGIGTSRLFLFATHGAAADSAHAAGAMAQAKAMAPAAQILGTFNCPGAVNPAVLEKVRKKDPQPPWIGDAPAAVGHPDQADLARLKAALSAALPEFVS
ncbi:MAG: flavodoxin family protein [Pseudomonadota bacterium]